MSFPFVALPLDLKKEINLQPNVSAKKAACKTYMLSNRYENDILFIPEDSWEKPVYQDYFYDHLQKHYNFLSSPYIFKVGNAFINGSFFYMNMVSGIAIVIKIFEPFEIVDFNKINHFLIGFTEKQIYEEPKFCASLIQRIVSSFEEGVFPFWDLDKKLILLNEQDASNLKKELKFQYDRRAYIPKDLISRFDFLENKKKHKYDLRDEDDLPF